MIPQSSVSAEAETESVTLPEERCLSNITCRNTARSCVEYRSELYDTSKYFAEILHHTYSIVTGAKILTLHFTHNYGNKL